MHCEGSYSRFPRGLLAGQRNFPSADCVGRCDTCAGIAMGCGPGPFPSPRREAGEVPGGTIFPIPVLCAEPNAGHDLALPC